MFLFGLYSVAELLTNPQYARVESDDVWFYGAFLFATASYIGLACWALFSQAGRAHLAARSRETSKGLATTVGPIFNAWRFVSWSAAFLALAAMSLMLIGSFTVEWTCQCEGPDQWRCKGPNCESDMNAHFNATRHTVSCSRSDWPMRILGRLGDFVLAK
jgi:hypothetical protein